IDYTYVCSSAGVAKGASFAVDHGARVINMSLGCTTASRMLRGAFEYARRNNVLAFDAMANEFSFHQNVPAIFHHVVGVGAVTANSRNGTTTWLQKANFSNFGAHVQLVGPTDMPGASMALSGALANHSAYSTIQSGTSSSTPHAVGVAALVFSRARDLVEGGMLPVGGLALQGAQRSGHHADRRHELRCLDRVGQMDGLWAAQRQSGRRHGVGDDHPARGRPD